MEEEGQMRELVGVRRRKRAGMVKRTTKKRVVHKDVFFLEGLLLGNAIP